MEDALRNERVMSKCDIRDGVQYRGEPSDGSRQNTDVVEHPVFVHLVHEP